MVLAVAGFGGLVIAIAAAGGAFLADRVAAERERRRRARAIRVGWMPLDPSVDEIKLKMNCEQAFQ
jgi:hypothetical protein